MTLTCLPVGLDPVDLRRACRRFGTGVTVFTTRAVDEIRVGVRASSFNTVSLKPPVVLWSRSVGSSGLPLLKDPGLFAVNMPPQGGCAAAIECAVIDEHLIGDHVLSIEQDRRYAHGQADPLLFFNRQYVQAVDLHAPQPI